MIAEQLKGTLPGPVRMALYKLVIHLRRITYRRALNRRLPIIPKDGIYVNFGGVATSNDVVHGGKVKLGHLSLRFGEHSERFNLLYLVSSTLPHYPEELATWAKKNGAKLVYNQDGVAYPAWAGDEYSRINKKLRRILLLADYVIYQSKFCKASADCYLGQPKAPYEILHNCVDTKHFIARPNEKLMKPWMLVAAGTHQQYERVSVVLETLSQLAARGHDVRLILAGKLDFIDAEKRYACLAERLNVYDRIERVSPFSQEEAAQFYQRAHVLLHPKYKDPCPTIVIEAMSSGVPVVGSKSGGMPELVGDEAGVLIEVPESWDDMYVPPANQMADAVEVLMSNWQEKSSIARRRAERLFDKEVWLARHTEIFEQVLRLD